MTTTKNLPALGVFISSIMFGLLAYAPADAAYKFADFTAHPPIHLAATSSKVPTGITPLQIKSLYHLPASGGSGTIILIGAYDSPEIEQDLATFSKTFNLPVCTSKNGCLKKHLMSATTSPASSGWALETALDVEWAHAIAPTAKLLLVEAATPSGANLLKAIDYAAKQKGISAIAMSWGGTEFADELALDKHFKSVSGTPFFAAAGDTGAGVSWPAVSPNVIAVGGTTLSLSNQGVYEKESAWQGSGGGVSAYEKAPAFQASSTGSRAGGMRAVPDVAYDADPASGFPIVHKGVWHTAGGTSAGAPQWAAIASLGTTVRAEKLYADARSAKSTSYFRDILTGENGTCGFFCAAHARYDYVTGLGTPQTATF